MLRYPRLTSATDVPHPQLIEQRESLQVVLDVADPFGDEYHGTVVRHRHDGRLIDDAAVGGGPCGGRVRARRGERAGDLALQRRSQNCEALSTRGVPPEAAQRERECEPSLLRSLARTSLVEGGVPVQARETLGIDDEQARRSSLLASTLCGRRAGRGSLPARRSAQQPM
jgi:hypothetical protein